MSEYIKSFDELKDILDLTISEFDHPEVKLIDYDDPLRIAQIIVRILSNYCALQPIVDGLNEPMIDVLHRTIYQKSYQPGQWIVYLPDDFTELNYEPFTINDAGVRLSAYRSWLCVIRPMPTGQFVLWRFKFGLLGRSVIDVSVSDNGFDYYTDFQTTRDDIYQSVKEYASNFITADLCIEPNRLADYVPYYPFKPMMFYSPNHLKGLYASPEEQIYSACLFHKDRINLRDYLAASTLEPFSEVTGNVSYPLTKMFNSNLVRYSFSTIDDFVNMSPSQECIMTVLEPVGIHVHDLSFSLIFKHFPQVAQMYTVQPYTCFVIVRILDKRYLYNCQLTSTDGDCTLRHYLIEIDRKWNINDLIPIPHVKWVDSGAMVFDDLNGLLKFLHEQYHAMLEIEAVQMP